MSAFEKLQNIDLRWVYLLVWIAVLGPLMWPLGLPVTVGRDSSTYYNYINDMPDGSVVMFTFDYGVSAMPELFPMTVATFHQLWSRDFKVVVVASWVDGPRIMNMVMEQLKPEQNYQKVYGEDWIELGYFPGSEVGMAALAKDIHGTLAVDYIQNKPTSSFPIMQNIKTAQDIDLIVAHETGTPGLPEWVRQWVTPYDIKMIVGCIGVQVPEVAPYLQAGQCKALLPGLTASAEYELLLRRPGIALSGVDAVSMSHILVIALVVIGNVGFMMARGKRGS